MKEAEFCQFIMIEQTGTGCLNIIKVDNDAGCNQHQFG